MTLVTIAASYGAGGSRVAPALARRLDVPFLDRPDTPEPLLSKLGSLAVSWGTPPGMSTEELLPDDAARREFEREVRAAAEHGRGVILGRGAAAVLRGHPTALHVLLDGPVEARVRQAMALEGLDHKTAERRLYTQDRFRRAYLEDLYAVDVREPGLFHLVLDSTAFALPDCVDLIVDAARRRARLTGSSSTT